MAPLQRAKAARLQDASPTTEDSMDVDEPQVKLKTSDGKRFTLTKSVASCSNALRTMIESNQNAANASTEYINLQSVNSHMLTKVIDWCQMHCDESQDEYTDAIYLQKVESSTDKWKKNFFNSMNEKELFNLTNVANYLDVRSLYDACCQTIGKSWEGKRVEEIRKMYKIENDYPPEEEHLLLVASKKLGMDN